MLRPDPVSWNWQDVLDATPVETVATESGTIGYRRAGSGKRVVLLHGIGSGSGSWAYQLDSLSKHFDVLAWDAPGYGESTPPAAEWPTAADFAASLGNLLDVLDVRHAVIIGHSLGAPVAARFAADAPDRVGGLVLADPATGHGRMDPDERRRRLEDRLGRFDRLGPAVHACERAPRLLSEDATEEQLALVEWNLLQLNRPGYVKAARLLSCGDIHFDAVRLEVPSLVLCGARDVITPPEDCRRVAEAIGPECPYVEIEEAGHVCYVESPARFNQLIKAFLEGVE